MQCGQRGLPRPADAPAGCPLFCDAALAGRIERAEAQLIAGGASLRMAEGMAQFTGAATAPTHRRRGVQSALL